MNHKKLFYLILAFLGICILAFIFLMVKIVKVNSECAQNPFTYAANKIVDNEGEVIYSVCSCSVNGIDFYFDNKGIYEKHPLMKFIN